MESSFWINKQSGRVHGTGMKKGICVTEMREGGEQLEQSDQFSRPLQSVRTGVYQNTGRVEWGQQFSSNSAGQRENNTD